MSSLRLPGTAEAHVSTGPDTDWPRRLHRQSMLSLLPHASGCFINVRSVRSAFVDWFCSLTPTRFALSRVFPNTAVRHRREDCLCHARGSQWKTQTLPRRTAQYVSSPLSFFLPLLLSLSQTLSRSLGSKWLFFVFHVCVRKKTTYPSLIDLNHFRLFLRYLQSSYI